MSASFGSPWPTPAAFPPSLRSGHPWLDAPAPWRRPAAAYLKQGKLGEGTFGEVVKAIKQETNEVVAIKRIRRRASKSGLELPTLREIMLLQELQHENVIMLHEVYVHNGNINLVFEFCSTDLERVINDKKMILDPARIKACMLGTLRGLAYCHASWVLHRDMKPGNLLLAADGTVKLADFGLARVFGSPDRKYTGQVVTRWYRAPELLFGAKFYGSPVDLCSVGCIFAEMMLRVAYFPGTSDIDQLARIFTALGTPTEATWPGLSSLPDYVPFQPVPGTPLRDVFTAASKGEAATPPGTPQLPPRGALATPPALGPWHPSTTSPCHLVIPSRPQRRSRCSASCSLLARRIASPLPTHCSSPRWFDTRPPSGRAHHRVDVSLGLVGPPRDGIGDHCALHLALPGTPTSRRTRRPPPRRTSCPGERRRRSKSPPRDGVRVRGGCCANIRETLMTYSRRDGDAARWAQLLRRDPRSGWCRGAACGLRLYRDVRRLRSMLRYGNASLVVRATVACNAGRVS